MPSRTIAVKVLCVLRHADRIFLLLCTDPGEQRDFYKLPGGSVEFGETSREAVIREIREELGAEIVDVRRLGVLEHFGTYSYAPFHEIALIYEAQLADPTLYSVESLEITDDAWTGEGMDHWIGRWVPLETFRSGQERLSPPGLLGLLDGSAP